MRKSKAENRKLSVQVTAEQESFLRKMAAAENKSLSLFVRDILFSPQKINTAKIDFYTNINSDLNFLKQYIYILLQFTMHRSSEQNDKTKVKNFFEKLAKEYDEKFSRP